jgi:NIPSNAP
VTSDDTITVMSEVVELRQYTLHPGQRDVLVDIFLRHFVDGQQAAGMRILGTYYDLDDPDRFVWLRGFPDMAARKDALTRFYFESDAWRTYGPAANATMVDSTDVLLLRPVNDVPLPVAPLLTAAIEPLAGQKPVNGKACFETEPAENNFPRLPVRSDGPKFVWFTDEEHAGQSLRLAPVDAKTRP